MLLRSNKYKALGSVMRFMALGLSVGLGVGCAHNEAVSPEQEVSRRASEYYAALSLADYDAALKYTTPGYRKTAQAERYHIKYSASPSWMSTDVVGVDCGEEAVPTRCNVRTNILAKLHKSMPPMITPVDSLWLSIDGKWYRYEE